MVGQSLWKNLKQLVELDRHVSALLDEIAQAQSLIAKEQSGIPVLEQLLKQKQQALHDAQKRVNMAELNAEDLKNLENKKRHDLDLVKNQKEYEAVSRELERVMGERSDLEESLIQSWHQLDLSKKEADDAVKSTHEKKIHLTEGIATQQETYNAIIKRMEDLQKQRQIITDTIPAEWLSRYEEMKTSVENPFVPIADTACSSCYYTILRQDLIRIQRGAVLPCRSCYRLLYYDKVETPTT